MTSQQDSYLVRMRRSALLCAAVLLLWLAQPLPILAETRIKAPDAVATALTNVIGNSLGIAGEVDVSGVYVVSFPGRKRSLIRMEGVRLDAADAGWAVNLDRVDLAMELASVLSGKLAPSSVAISGVTVTWTEGSFAPTMQSGLPLQVPALDLPKIEAALSSVIDMADDMDLERLTVARLTISGEASSNVAGMLGGWFSVAGTGSGWHMTAGGHLTLGETVIGNFRILGSRDQGGVSTAIHGNFSLVETQRFAGSLLGDTQSWPVDSPIDASFKAAWDQHGRVERANATLRAGKGSILGMEGQESWHLESAIAELELAPDSGRVELTRFDLNSSVFAATGTGHAYLLGEQGPTSSLEGRLDIAGLTLLDTKTFPLPPRMISGATHFKINWGGGFELRLANLAVSIDGSVVNASGEIGRKDGHWHGRARLNSQELQQGALFGIWPVGLLSKPRRWLDANVQDAMLHGVASEFSYAGKDGWSGKLTLQFSDATVTYLPSLPPATASGYFELTDSVAAFRFEEGHVEVADAGVIDLAGSDILIPKVTDGRVPARIRLNVSGELTPVFHLLDNEPYGLLRRIGFRPDLANGNGVAQAEIRMPLLKNLSWNDVWFALQGGISGVRASSGSANVEFASDRLDVEATNEGIEISGSGTVSGQAASGKWQIGFGPGEDQASLLVGKLSISRRLLDNFGVAVPAGLLENARSVDLYVTFAPGSPPHFGIKSNASNLGFSLPLIGSDTDPDTGTSVLIEGKLSKEAEITRVAVSGADFSAEGRFGFDPENGNAVLDFPNVVIGDWFDVSVRYRMDERNGSRLEFIGGEIDLGRAPTGSFDLNQARESGQTILIRLDRLTFNSSIFLAELVGEIDFSKPIEGALTGKINGGELVGVRVGSSAHGLLAYFATSDAGAVMRDAGVTTGLRGGALELTLVPEAEPGSYRGQMRILNAVVREMPSLSAILNMLSIVGLLDQLLSNGISFSEIEAEFSVSRETINLVKGTAIGPSIGIRMSGGWNMEANYVDIDGVITPFNPISELARKTPLQFIGITKGSGLGAISFAVEGPQDNLSISANPLSVLTPGIFRRLLNF